MTKQQRAREPFTAPFPEQPG